MDTKTLKELINNLLHCDMLQIEGDGHHFFIRVVSSAFIGLSRLERHRLIKAGLSQELASNELHALSIVQAATPAEISGSGNHD